MLACIERSPDTGVRMSCVPRSRVVVLESFMLALIIAGTPVVKFTSGVDFGLSHKNFSVGVELPKM
jgi:hypothetical protein